MKMYSMCTCMRYVVYMYMLNESVHVSLCLPTDKSYHRLTGTDGRKRASINIHALVRSITRSSDMCVYVCVSYQLLTVELVSYICVLQRIYEVRILYSLKVTHTFSHHAFRYE